MRASCARRSSLPIVDVIDLPIWAAFRANSDREPGFPGCEEPFACCFSCVVRRDWRWAPPLVEDWRFCACVRIVRNSVVRSCIEVETMPGKCGNGKRQAREIRGGSWALPDGQGDGFGDDEEAKSTPLPSQRCVFFWPVGSKRLALVVHQVSVAVLYIIERLLVLPAVSLAFCRCQRKRFWNNKRVGATIVAVYLKTTSVWRVSMRSSPDSKPGFLAWS